MATITIEYLTREEEQNMFNEAEKGNKYAQYELARYFEQEVGLFDMAYEWLKKAAEQNHPRAQFDYGEICWERDEWDEAIEWYKRSAENGYGKAKSRLIELMYFVKWYKQAEKNGDPEEILDWKEN